jgi:succinate-semialdehyde dehydrogenase/glutarate-semialdehyde dehydrogenase
VSPDALPLHDESRALVPATPERIFALVDDHERLASHMNRSSWRMGGGRMRTILDEHRGQRVGSHIRVNGRVFGLELSLDEVVTMREPPTRKAWETVGSPRLLVIGPYRMGFDLTPSAGGTLLRVFIDYALPSSWPARWLGRAFGGSYAHWCTQRMVDDAVRQFQHDPLTTITRKEHKMAYQSRNPYDGKVLKTFKELTDPQLESALQTAATCFDTWRHTTFAERTRVIKRAAGILRARSEDFARPITLEMGKLMEESRGEVALSADILDYYADHAERFLAPQRLSPASGEATIDSRPLGVLFGVEPWNFPYYQLARFVAPNLMAGNVVLVKHASNVPQCAIAFADLFIEAGAPKGAYTNLLISKTQVARVIADARIKGVALTGSEEAGAIVAGQAGQALKKSTMELGGSDAFIVLEDADLEATVKWALWGRINNAGQCCVAAKRFIVVEKVADRFLAQFTAAMGGLKTGDPMDKATTLAPLSSTEALDKLVDQVDRAVAQGARVVMGGKRVAGVGAFMQPTILTDIKPGTPAYTEEFFGPVALFFRVRDEDAAVALANDSSFGLGGSVFTKDIARGKRVADRIETGMVFINHPTWTAADLPFGGIKHSGYGRELSSMGIQEFVNKKLVRVAAIDAPA